MKYLVRDERITHCEVICTKEQIFETLKNLEESCCEKSTFEELEMLFNDLDMDEVSE